MLPPVVLLLGLLPLSIVCFDILLDCFVLLETCVEAILDIVVDPPRHELLNLDPLVLVHLVQLHQLEVLCHSPFLLVQVGIDVVIPALSALLPDPPREKSGDFLPLFEAELGYFLPEDHVFLRRPVSFDLLNSAVFSVVSELQPPVHALHFRLGGVEGELALGQLQIGPLGLNVLVQSLVDLLDVLNFVDVDERYQLEILKIEKNGND